METMAEELKYHYKYPHPSVTTDCVIFGFDGTRLNVLLIERGNDPYKGCWAFPGGFLNMDESALEGAKRELYEETGLRDAYIHQFHAFSAPDRDPRERVISIAYFALVRLTDVKAGDDAAKAQWFPLDEIPPLAFDHDKMLREALKALRRLIHFEPIGVELLPENFTKTQMQTLYEAILGGKSGMNDSGDKMLKLEI
jgi:8-oxo-dGTP diphosphatase